MNDEVCVTLGVSDGSFTQDLVVPMDVRTTASRNVKSANVSVINSKSGQSVTS
ncbi:MAG: hypothetical protein ACR2FX_13465 [Chthoniobacterales bacterium]